jgi:hypothetical protein
MYVQNSSPFPALHAAMVGGSPEDYFLFFMYKTARRFQRCTQPWLGEVLKRMLLSGVLMPLPVIRYV